MAGKHHIACTPHRRSSIESLASYAEIPLAATAAASARKPSPCHLVCAWFDTHLLITTFCYLTDLLPGLGALGNDPTNLANLQKLAAQVCTAVAMAQAQQQQQQQQATQGSAVTTLAGELAADGSCQTKRLPEPCQQQLCSSAYTRSLQWQPALKAADSRAASTAYIF